MTDPEPALFEPMPLPVRWKQVKDPRGHWYDAKIVGERGEGEEREVKVHYHGWKQSLDEWILASSDRILDEDEELPEEAHDWGTERGHIDEDQWEVEAIVKRRRKNNKDGAVVRWAGLNKEGEAWAPSWVALEDVCPELLDEFENPPEVPALPFVEKVSATIAPEIADSLVVEWRDDIGRQAAKLLARQRDEFACRRPGTARSRCARTTRQSCSCRRSSSSSARAGRRAPASGPPSYHRAGRHRPLHVPG